MIEAQERSIYSHMGVVVGVNPLMVAEALGKVRLVGFMDFNSKTERGQKLSLLRLKNPDHVKSMSTHSSEFMALFKQEFEHKTYDHDFLWNNVDANGSEKLYCSEMVAKLYQRFLGNVEIPIKRMLFDVHTEFWRDYFKGKIPVGEWGNSPADFERSPLFNKMGEI